MRSKPLGSIIKAAVIAGLAAGLLTAVFHFFVTEPVMERAIELEDLLMQAQGVTGEELLVDRGVQRGGLFLGFLLYGLTWGLLFGAAYRTTERWLPFIGARLRGPLLVLLAGWSVAVFPFLKYPANPPGVGDPGTVQYRQIIFFAFIALSALNTLIALLLRRYLSQPGGAPWRKDWSWTGPLAMYVAGAAGLYLAMPANPDPIMMPADLVWRFRALSLAGLTVFWGVFAGGFALVTWAFEASRPRRGSFSASPNTN